MPNGGSDCCGTCWFNTANHGQPGHPPAGRSREPAFCEIRGNLPIPHPFYTYCPNHPHHNRDRVRVPIGPVYVADGSVSPRCVWVLSPDTEEVRSGLLDLLRGTEPDTAFPGFLKLKLAAAAAHQLGEFGEPRALPELDRLRTMPVGPDWIRLPASARQALARIIPPEAVAPYRTPTAVSIAEGYAAAGDPTARPVLADALEEAGCSHGPALAYLRTPVPPGRPCWVVDLVRGTEPRTG